MTIPLVPNYSSFLINSETARPETVRRRVEVETEIANLWEGVSGRIHLIFQEKSVIFYPQLAAKPANGRMIGRLRIRFQADEIAENQAGGKALPLGKANSSSTQRRCRSRTVEMPP